MVDKEEHDMRKRILLELQKAIDQGRTHSEYVDKDGKRVTLDFRKVDQNAICSPYDSQ